MFLWTLDARPEEVNGDPELLGSNGSLFRNEREPLTVGLCLQGHAAQPGQPKGPTGQLGELCPHAPTSYFPNPGPVFLLVTRKNWGSVYEREIAAFVPETLLGKGEKEQEEVLFSKTWGRRMLVAGVGGGGMTYVLCSSSKLEGKMLSLYMELVRKIFLVTRSSSAHCG